MPSYMIWRCVLSFAIAFWLTLGLAINHAWPAEARTPKSNKGVCLVNHVDGPRNTILKDDKTCKSHLRWVPLPGARS